MKWAKKVDLKVNLKFDAPARLIQLKVLLIKSVFETIKGRIIFTLSVQYVVLVYVSEKDIEAKIGKPLRTPSLGRNYWFLQNKDCS